MTRTRDENSRLPTLNDVAKRANVSRQTISRVINDKDEVAQATRERVWEAIRELGYQPNSLARSLVTSKTKVIGLSVPNIDQPFFPQIALGLEDTANRSGYSVFLCNVGGDPEREMQAFERLRGHRVAGIISFNSRMNDEMVEEVTSGHFPVMLINRESSSARGAIIWPGYEQGGYLATRHLLDLGQRDILFLGLDRHSNIDTNKLNGYRRAQSEAGIEPRPELVIHLETATRSRSFHDLVHGGFTAVENAVKCGLEFDGVFASNDLPAIGMVRFAAETGLRIPEDVALIGFGGSEVAEIVTPALSTISMPLYAMGSAAFRSLLDEIDGADPDIQAALVAIEPVLLARQSTIGR